MVRRRTVIGLGIAAVLYPGGGHIRFGHDRAPFEAIDGFLKEIGYR